MNKDMFSYINFRFITALVIPALLIIVITTLSVTEQYRQIRNAESEISGIRDLQTFSGIITDIQTLRALALQLDHSSTLLPQDMKLLQDRILANIKHFRKNAHTPEFNTYSASLRAFEATLKETFHEHRIFGYGRAPFLMITQTLLITASTSGPR